ncbi:flavodoxin family protein [Microlunatus ginsengisoli]
MRSMVVYESYFGCTQQVAEAIGAGLTCYGTVHVLPVAQARGMRAIDVDLLVVGGPTHAHAMTSAHSRESAVDRGADGVSAEAPAYGLREWFDEIEQGAGPAAAFDTRIDASALMTGRASKGIAHRLRRHGFHLVAEPESFLVSHDTLLPDEAARARSWAEGLGRIIVQTPASVR